jgi:hypothetical protein
LRLASPGPAPIVSYALEHTTALDAVEKDIRGRGADERRAVRQQKVGRYKAKHSAPKWRGRRWNP